MKGSHRNVYVYAVYRINDNGTGAFESGTEIRKKGQMAGDPLRCDSFFDGSVWRDSVTVVSGIGGAEIQMREVAKKALMGMLPVVFIALVAGGWFLHRHFSEKESKERNKPKQRTEIEVIEEKLKLTAELNTGSYLCTDILTRTESKTLKGWTIPLTEKYFIISYDGIVKAGIRDLTKAQVTQKGNTITIKLPEIEITETEIDNDSFEKLDESNNIFNPVTTEDLNAAQQELKNKMVARAKEKGLLDVAKRNAETILSSMLKSPNSSYQIKIEWL